MTSKNVRIAIFASIAIALAVTPSASSWGLFISQEVKAVASISGRGTGNVLCPTAKPSTIFFSATGSGSWNIFGPGVTGFKSGKIANVVVSNGVYTATGSETSNSLCSGAGNAASVTITGNCGTSSISFRTSNGQSGTFTGSVSCSSGGSTCSSGSATATSTSTSGSTATACGSSSQPASCQTSGTGTATATSGSTTVTCPR